MRRAFTIGRATLVLVAMVQVVLPAPAGAEGSRTGGRVFEPKPVSRPAYSVTAPNENPDLQRRFVEASDGTRIFVETYLPEAKDGRVPPDELPNVLIMTPYANLDRAAPEGQDHVGLATYLGQRGYAVSIGHVYGTGASGGCQEFGPKEVEATSRVIEYLGSGAPWTNGRVGMTGLSYDGWTAIAAAASGDDVARRYLKAIVPVAGATSYYASAGALDGVPFTGAGLLFPGSYAGLSVVPAEGSDPSDLPQRPGCHTTTVSEGAQYDATGNFSDFTADREQRLRVERVSSAVLQFQGFSDVNVNPTGIAGWFDRLPDETPHKLVWGQWDHVWPDRQTIHPEWNRADFLPMMVAWFDRYLKGFRTGVEKWPTVQVQDSTGAWRSEPDWPLVRGTFGQLALTGAGDGDPTLGSTAPTGATTYAEAANSSLPGSATFVTAPLDRPLHITGQPVLDLWLKLSHPDAHIAVRMQVERPDGEPVSQPLIYGARSAKHIAVMQEDVFLQRVPSYIEAGEPIRVPVRLTPTDVIVPEGAVLKVTVSGALSDQGTTSSTATATPPTTSPSGAPTVVTILHDCSRPSVLRFTMPARRPRSLNVREASEANQVLTRPKARVEVVDGGIASSPICDQEAVDPQSVTRGESS